MAHSSEQGVEASHDTHDDPLGDAHTLSAPPSRASTTPELPRVARDAYVIGQEVAQGGIGRVSWARDRRLDRPVAIKELLVWTERQERRFVREALLTARLQHPAIVPIYEAARWPEGAPFYAMKLVSGRSLADLVAQSRSFTERLSLLPHVLTVAQAVAYAHSLRIIHRDLKPANVLVGEFGETVVIDWGLAKDLGEDEPVADSVGPGGEGLTIDGAIMGTPSYMPPEQAAGAAVDERADVYALGAVLYHVLAAVAPYDGAPWERLLVEIAGGPPRSIEQLAPLVPDELAAIVHKAMAREPADRYRTAAEMAADLERFQTGRIVAAHTYSARQLLARYWRRHRTALTVAAAALVLVAGVLFAAFVKTDRARQFAELKEREAVEASRAADLARHAAEDARAQATARADGITLLQAQDALRRDPNKALAWLKTLSPEFADAARVRRIAADAQARGISRAFRGHSEFINRVSVAPDGATFVTASDDKTARVWDLANGEARVLAGHDDEIWNAQHTLDGATIATVSKDSTLRLWDARTGAARAVFAVSPTRELMMRADGAILGGRTNSGAAWILRPGATAVESLTPAADPPRFSNLSLDGRRLIVQPHAGDVYVRDVEGERRRDLPGTRGATGKWFLDRRGDVAINLAADAVVLWDLATMTPRPLDVGTHSRRPAFSYAGDRVAFAVGADIVVHAVRTGALVRRLVGHEGPIEMVGFASDDRRLVSGSVDRTVRTWNLGSGASEVLAGFEGVVTDAELLADGRSILAVSTAGEVRLFEPRRAGRIVTDHDAPTTGLALSHDGRAASLDERGRLRICDLDGRLLAEHAVPPAPQPHLLTAPDGRRFAGLARSWISVPDGRHPDRDAAPARLLLGSFDGAAPTRHDLPAAALELVWRTDGGAVLVALADGSVLQVDIHGAVVERDRFAAPATSLAVSPDGAWLAAGSEDGSLRLTGLATGEHRPLARHDERVTALAFAPGGTWLASGCADHTARLWRLQDGSFRAFDEGGHGVEQLAFSADGGALFILSGGETQLRHLSVETGDSLPPLPGHLGKLLGFTVAADGRRLLTHGADGAVRVIDLADGEGRTLAGHTLPITGAGFAAGGRTIVTLGREGTLRAWPDDLPETMPELRAWLDAATPERIAGR
ncbi:WD40 repeat domain-containing serine/threonine protein kinase [Nannocystis bainbridge]|uniref:Serine/threonine-protein kinase n=1 Tax=Nannocystis bainbridge TaxID=2995303 RepID=A0ABT5EC27_9BACT|nr:serine/threonine-protein kinase [Nannocystis bainbridge]MDC0723411.1 serine/threonine-protein kinase [Nannocystis bainbridge]